MLTITVSVPLLFYVRLCPSSAQPPAMLSHLPQNRGSPSPSPGGALWSGPAASQTPPPATFLWRSLRSGPSGPDLSPNILACPASGPSHMLLRPNLACHLSSLLGVTLSETPSPSPSLRVLPSSLSRLSRSAANLEGTVVRSRVRDHPVPTLACELPETRHGCLTVSLQHVWWQHPERSQEGFMQWMQCTGSAYLLVGTLCKSFSLFWYIFYWFFYNEHEKMTVAFKNKLKNGANLRASGRGMWTWPLSNFRTR